MSHVHLPRIILVITVNRISILSANCRTKKKSINNFSTDYYENTVDLFRDYFYHYNAIIAENEKHLILT